MKTTKEVSVVGGVSGFVTPLPITSKQKKRKRMAKARKKRKVPYTQVDEQSHKIIRDTIFSVLLNEAKSEDKISYIMSLFEGIGKQMGVSMGYTKTFITDGLKMGELDQAKKLSFRRAKTELNHVKRLIDDLDVLIEQIHEISNKPEPTEEVEEAYGRKGIGWAGGRKQGRSKGMASKDWMKKVEDIITKKDPSRAGKMDWDSLKYLHSTNVSPEEAAAKMLKR